MEMNKKQSSQLFTGVFLETGVERCGCFRFEARTIANEGQRSGNIVSLLYPDP
jgi:hypothetical protein